MNMPFRHAAKDPPGKPDAAQALSRWQAYLEALDCAGQAMDRARRLVPDHGLDHGVERIRALLLAGVAELERLQSAAAQNTDRGVRDQAAAGVSPDQ